MLFPYYMNGSFTISCYFIVQVIRSVSSHPTCAEIPTLHNRMRPEGCVGRFLEIVHVQVKLYLLWPKTSLLSVYWPGPPKGTVDLEGGEGVAVAIGVEDAKEIPSSLSGAILASASATVSLGTSPVAVLNLF